MNWLTKTAARFLRKRGFLVMEDGGPQMLVKMCFVQRLESRLIVYPLQGTTKGMDIAVLHNSQLIDCNEDGTVK